MTQSLNDFILIAILGFWFFAIKAVYYQITEPFRLQLEKLKDHLNVKEICDGCGETFNHHLHDHFGYRSCSIDCDSFLDEVFVEQVI